MRKWLKELVHDSKGEKYCVTDDFLNSPLFLIHILGVIILRLNELLKFSALF